MISKIDFKYVVTSVAALIGFYLLLSNNYIPNTNECSSDFARPCYEQSSVGNLQAKVSVSREDKGQKLDKERGEKEFSACMKDYSNRRGQKKEKTKICESEVVQYCEGKWSGEKNKNNKNNDDERGIKKYAGKCDATPPPVPPIVATPPKTLSYSFTKIDKTPPVVVHAVVPGEQYGEEELMRIHLSTPATNERPISLQVEMVTRGHSTNAQDQVPCDYFSSVPSAAPYMWFENINDKTDINGRGLIIGDNSLSPPLNSPYFSGSCSITFIFDPIVPGTQKDFALKTKIFVPPAQAKLFTLLVKPYAWYDGIDYAVENGGYQMYPARYMDGSIVTPPTYSALFISDAIQIVLP